MQSSTEEDYLKAIFKLNINNKNGVSTNSIAKEINTKASSVTDMIKKLSEKGLVNYIKYQGSTLSKEGRVIALKIIRKHRLWEVFLVEKLKFKWDEIHDIAEQLEHIKSPELVDRLDKHLGFPKTDPHGDPIPNKQGEFTVQEIVTLNNLKINDKGNLISVSEDSKEFLNYLDGIQLKLGSSIEVIDLFEFDKSLKIKVNNNLEVTISQKVASNLNVSKI